MSVFNPKILDASLRDVAASLPDQEKVDVLLYAMERLKIERSVPVFTVKICNRSLRFGITSEYNNYNAPGREISLKTQFSPAY